MGPVTDPRIAASLAARRRLTAAGVSTDGLTVTTEQGVSGRVVTTVTRSPGQPGWSGDRLRQITTALSGLPDVLTLTADDVADDVTVAWTNPEALP